MDKELGLARRLATLDKYRYRWLRQKFARVDTIAELTEQDAKDFWAYTVGRALPRDMWWWEDTKARDKDEC